MIRPLLLLFAVVFLGAARAQDLGLGPLPVAPTPTPDPASYVPDVARIAAKEGNDAFGKGDYKGARVAYLKVLDLAPGNLVALVNLGLIEYRSGNSSGAENYLTQALQKDLQTGPAWFTLGMIYFEQDQLDEAYGALSQAVVYEPTEPRAHNYLGVVLGRKGWLDGAEAELRRAVEINPGYQDAHYNLAIIYLQRKPPAIELARRHYFKSIDLGGQRDPEVEKSLTVQPTNP